MKKFKYRDHFIIPSKKQKNLIKKTLDLSFSFFDGTLRNNKFLRYKSAEYFRKKLDCPLPKNTRKIEDSLKDLRSIGKYSIAQFDLNYLSFPDSGNSLVSMMGTIFSKFLNQNLIGFDRSAPIATFVEIQLIEWLRELIGYKSKPLKDIESLSDVSGMWTTGGHMSNHIAILAALNKKFPEIKQKGISNLKFSPVILLSKKISHYSIEAAAHHLGLGKNSIIDIPVYEDFTTNCSKVKEIIESLPKNKKPFMIVSVAGNTRTSSIDDLLGISKICQKYNIWNHVDACHGGSLFFSNRLKKKYLKGINLSDSVTIDPHKGLFVTYPSSYVLFKDRKTLTTFSRYEKECYEGNVWDLGFITPFFGSRGFESLNLWLFIKSIGKKGLEETVEYREKIARYAEKLVLESGFFVTLNKMDFYRMAFIFCPKIIHEYIQKYGSSFSNIQIQKIRNLIDNVNHKINQCLYESGKLCLDEYKLHDVGNVVGLGTDDRFTVFAITIGNPLYTEKSIKHSLSILFKESRKEKKRMIEKFFKIIRSNCDSYDEYKNKNLPFGPAGW